MKGRIEKELEDNERKEGKTRGRKDGRKTNKERENNQERQNNQEKKIFGNKAKENEERNTQEW